MIQPTKKSDRVKITLIVLSAVAAALGVITVIVVFYPVGSYQPVTLKGSGTVPAPSSTLAASPTPTSTASSTLPSGTTSSTAPAFATGTFASTYLPPYPVTWNDGHEQFSITSASLQENKLTLVLAILMGNTPECVPLNVRLVADESGTLKAPDVPPNATFSFPDSRNCIGTASTIYSQSLAFTIDPGVTSFLFTTGGASNIFFNAATTTAGGVKITLPGNSG